MKDVTLPEHALKEAIARVGDGPVVMMNLLTFRDSPLYPEGFADRKASARAAYYEGYAGAFGQIAAQLGIVYELVHAGRQLLTLVPPEPESWDDIVLVRYRNLSDLRRITETDDYARLAAPHRLAAIAAWRFIATQS
ncbi:hypothetical protein GGE43_004032 [Agrobacterium tumefaciens]|uniref:DUF1330 domain-containing protein n=1 Tax=Agrobacterium radiobacter TaxID=362 RepID=A0ABR6JDY9_AGRRD|nr:MULTISPECIES: hypothetical protein [Agrobacterium tumefaciens complex]MBB4320515.1 hypothetical protein [Agrobacterium radiobacter]MBB4337180.1 hypothetical protein [Agrobacterium radiobacter]MBB4492572.1 hypothetical protein [Agrobacterium radiobacter]MBB4497470.1 hypothetical protein [Agrobacterium radiobacter]MBB4502619.1 hypothetical protein [Agrobacterium radiobacter]